MLRLRVQFKQQWNVDKNMAGRKLSDGPIPERPKTHKTNKRKIEVTPEFLVEVGQLAGQGMTNEHLAHYYGVAEGTWYEYKKNYPEIDEAIKDGKAKCLQIATSILWKYVLEGDKASLFFYLKTQGGMTETRNINAKVETTNDKPTTELKITTTDPIEASRIYQQFMMTTAGS